MTSGKRRVKGKIINQMKTHHTNFNRDTHKHVHSKATYRLLVEQFTVQHVGKGGKLSTNYSHKLQSWSAHVHSKATYLLSVEKITVQQVGKRGKIINQLITYHTDFNHRPESAQTCSLKGNSPAVSGTVHSTASEERREKYQPNNNSSRRLQSWVCTNM